MSPYRQAPKPTRGTENQDDLPQPKYRDVEAPAEDVAEARLEQQREMGTAGSVAGPTALLATDAQGRGMLVGGSIGALIGAVLFLPLGLLDLINLDLVARVVIFSGCGAIAGGVAGAVFGGGRVPELEGEATDAPDEADEAPNPFGR